MVTSIGQRIVQSNAAYVEPTRLLVDLQQAEARALADRDNVEYPFKGTWLLGRVTAWLYSERVHRAQRDAMVATARVSAAMQMQHACDMAAVRRGKRGL